MAAFHKYWVRLLASRPVVWSREHPTILAIAGGVTVLIVFIAVPALLGIGKPSSQQTALWIRNAQAGADVLQRCATAIGIVVGGYFAWYKFVREGEHDPRLQPNIKGEITVQDDVIHVVVTATVQNTGKVDVILDTDACLVEIYTASADAPEWKTSVYDYVFEDHNQVQVGETIEDQVLFALPRGEEIALSLDLTVSGEEPDEESDLWIATEIMMISGGDDGKKPLDG